MLDLFISIPGPTFLWIFWAVSIVSIIAGWLLMRIDESSDNSNAPIPGPNDLDLLTIAALRGPEVVIRTVVFELWHNKNITIKDNEIKSVAYTYQKIGSPIHQAIYTFTKTAKSSADLFRDATLKATIEAHLAPIYEKLNQLYLLRTILDRLFAWLWFALTISVIWGLGISKFLLGLYYHRASLFLFLSLMIVSIAIMIWVNPFRKKSSIIPLFFMLTFSPFAGLMSILFLMSFNFPAFIILGIFCLVFGGLTFSTINKHIYHAVEPSNLGVKYLKSLEQQFDWLRDSLKIGLEPAQGVNPALGVAIFGTSILNSGNYFMKHVRSLKCLLCGHEYGLHEIDYVCPKHGDEGIVDVQYDYHLIDRAISRNDLLYSTDFSMWRYKPLLPIAPKAVVPLLAIGWTPLYRVHRLAAELGLKHVWVKDDGRLPTASFKDRASAMAVVKAQEKGATIITTASTGNAAAALSGICASVKQPNIIFVPETAPQAKIAQLLVFGSTVFLVKGTYDDAFELCLQAAKAYGWYNRNTAYNPYMTEGKKTAVYEICEQLGWQAPDQIFVSVGDGCIIGGLHKGLKDLLALGWIDRMPKLMGVQAAGSDYLYQAWRNNEDVFTKPPIKAQTVADSISAGLPRDRLKAMAAVKETSGAYISVTDEEILTAIPTLARGCGVFAEPAGATAYAGLVKAVHQGLVSAHERVVVLNTGNGLKDIASAMKSVDLVGTRPYSIAPQMADLQRVVADFKF